MLKKFLIAVLVLVVLLGIGITGAKAHYDGQVYQGYVPNLPVQYATQKNNEEEQYRYETFTFEGMNGDVIPVDAAFPKGQEGPFPTIIMLYGIGQKKNFLKDIAHEIAPHGFAIYIMEQYLRGEREVEGVTSDLHEFKGLRERATRNAVETRRLVDTLVTRPEVDKDNLYLWGLSFGTITGVPTFSQESRFKGAIFSIGGGDIQKMFSDSEAMQEGNGLLNSFLTWYLKPIDPLLHAENATGRPILFQNALQDEIIPRSSAEALHNAIGQPKEIKWYDTDHEGKVNDQAIYYFKDGVTWLKEQAGVQDIAAESAA